MTWRPATRANGANGTWANGVANVANGANGVKDLGSESTPENFSG
jgi:hypothetical protein